MPHAAPDDTQAQIDSLHRGIVVELRRRLSHGVDGHDGPLRPRPVRARSLLPRGSASLSRSIDEALRKVASMQALVRLHEETICDLREAGAERDRQHRLLEDSERRCREEAERASRAERLGELLEQRNARLEKTYADLARKVEGLLRAIASG